MVVSSRLQPQKLSIKSFTVEGTGFGMKKMSACWSLVVALSQNKVVSQTTVLERVGIGKGR